MNHQLHYLAANLMLASLPIVFALVMLIDRPYKETRSALALDVLTIVLGGALLIDWVFCAFLVLSMMVV